MALEAANAVILLFPCHPSRTVIQSLLNVFDGNPEHRWSKADITYLGLESFTAHRAFKQHFGVKFLEMAHLRRVPHGTEAIAQGWR